MAQLNLNVNVEELTEAILKSDMNNIMKSLTIAVLNAYMEVERDEYINAKPYERKAQRKDQRNGYYIRDYTLNIGKIKLKVPRTRSGEFKTEVFERYQRMDRAFVLAMMEMVVKGVSTRKVSSIVEQLCGENVSKSFVSNVTKELDPIIDKFKNRSLTHTKFRYLYVDAMYIKVRENNHVVSKAVYLAQGVNDDNKREIIGFTISDEESTDSWESFFVEMMNRGLKTPKLIISDAHAGLKTAITKIFIGSTWQRCTVHFLRNITNQLPRKKTATERQMIKDILHATTQQDARERKAAFEKHVQDNPKSEKAFQILDAGFEDAIQYMAEPQAYHISIRTTNSVERINREIRRRDKVIGIYPSIESATRLIGSVVLDLHETWQCKRSKFLQNNVNVLT